MTLTQLSLSCKNKIFLQMILRNIYDEEMTVTKLVSLKTSATRVSQKEDINDNNDVKVPQYLSNQI